MSTSYKEFMGFKTPVKTEADQIFDSILGNIKDDLIKQFQLQDEYSSIWGVLEAIEATKSEYSFLKEWFSNEGKAYVDEMDFELPDKDEILDFLDYQKYLIETEESEQTIRNLVLSITAFYKETSSFLHSLPIIKLNSSFFNKSVRIGIPISSAEKRTDDDEYEWKQKAGSPVDKKTGLLVCT